MDRHTIIFTTDKRLNDLGTLLTGKRVRCSWEEYWNYVGEKEQAECIFVFPTPVNKLDNYHEIKAKLNQELINKGAKCVFGGIFDEKWKTFLEENDIAYVDFTKLEEIVAENAQITAEAVLAEILQLSSYSMKGQNVMVTGFGACAKPIAEKLHALGAKVTIVARSEEARKKAAALGYQVCDFTTWEHMLAEATTVINTVPARVLTEAMLQKMQKDAVVLDIASKPGGTDFEAAKKLGISAKLALGLPGIYSTKSSACLYQKAMWKYAPLRELEKGEQSWIFQIII